MSNKADALLWYAEQNSTVTPLITIKDDVITEWNCGELTQPSTAEIETIITNYEASTVVVQKQRKQAYDAQGATFEALVVALWEKVVEGRDTPASDLQAIRAAIKSTYPLPE